MTWAFIHRTYAAKSKAAYCAKKHLTQYAAFVFVDLIWRILAHQTSYRLGFRLFYKCLPFILTVGRLDWFCYSSNDVLTAFSLHASVSSFSLIQRLSSTSGASAPTAKCNGGFYDSATSRSSSANFAGFPACSCRSAFFTKSVCHLQMS